ncbi:MAG: DUF5618 family protein [Bacteroidales bacterium]|nr:DUF5618 family protein [Bacteroidales bacterium]
MEKKNPIEEARRYYANAKEVIKKADYDPSIKSYKDGKYVRMAGNTLWNGCLIALDAVFDVRKGKKGHPDIDKYREAITKRDKKLLALVNNAYNSNHMYMGYDGMKNKKACDAGFEDAKSVIDRCEQLL